MQIEQLDQNALEHGSMMPATTPDSEHAALVKLAELFRDTINSGKWLAPGRCTEEDDIIAHADELFAAAGISSKHQADRPGTMKAESETAALMPGSVQRLVRRIWCFVRGHLCEPTGRHAILLAEWKCKRCGGIYVSHVHYGNTLMPSDDDSDRIFRDCMAMLKAANADPPNTKLTDSRE